MSWIVNNLGTILVSAVLLAVIALICVNLAKKKKKTGTTCSCGCGGCSMYSVCHKE